LSLLDLVTLKLCARRVLLALCCFTFRELINLDLFLNEIEISIIIFGMSEETTQNLPNDDLRRILAHLDSIDARLQKLEARAYDTKPIWENALKEIADTRVEMREGFEKVHVEIEKVRSEVETGMRRVERKIDILNQNILDVRADQKELEERVNKIDSQPAQ